MFRVPVDLGAQSKLCLFYFLLVSGRIDPDLDGEFRLCVQFSLFTAKLDDGRSVDVLRKCDEWVVDCRFYNLEMLLGDLEARVKWEKFRYLTRYSRAPHNITLNSHVFKSMTHVLRIVLKFSLFEIFSISVIPGALFTV